MAKELLSVSRNILASVNEGEKPELHPLVELVFTVTEPVHLYDASGTMIRQRTTESLRFYVSSEALRKLSKNLAEYADQADKALADAVAEEAAPAMEEALSTLGEPE